MPAGKTILGGVVAAFVIFYIITSPTQAATIADGIGTVLVGIWHLVVTLANGLGNFIDKLAS